MMMKKAGCRSSLVSTIRKHLETKGDAGKAARLQKYLKSEMPCCGVCVPERRKITSKVFAETFMESAKTPNITTAEWHNAICAIWDNAKYREERNAAIDLLRWEPCAAFLTEKALPLVEKLIVEGAWWDLVDDTVHALGTILKSDPSGIKQKLILWSVDPNSWKRRAAILSQLQFKEETDFDFMQSCIAPNLKNTDMFIRKSIGWALRDYAWHNPFAVQAYVDLNYSRLSPLSRREALKNLDSIQPGRVSTMPLQCIHRS
ncbi:MAG: DNA alkylation repair protein [Desulfovibrionales bacterium]|nr:DNA alkylation repair protein [Desulfovibrionales bacterium]